MSLCCVSALALYAASAVTEAMTMASIQLRQIIWRPLSDIAALSNLIAMLVRRMLKAKRYSFGTDWFA